MIEGKYYVYSHRNKINNKIYIGITKQNPTVRWGVDGKRYKDSPRFWNAIQKYGWDNFEHEILYENLSQSEAADKEQELIKKYRSNNEQFGYNMTSGGETHYIFTEEVREKLSQQKRGELNPQWGSHLTEEQKQHLSNIQRELTINGGQHSKKVRCIETGLVYYSCKEAARKTGSGNEKQGTHIADVCNGKRNKCNNYRWEWVKDDIDE